MYAIAWRPCVFSVRLSLQIFAGGFVILVVVIHTDAIFPVVSSEDIKPNKFIESGYGIRKLVINSFIAFVIDSYFIAKVFIVGDCLPPINFINEASYFGLFSNCSQSLLKRCLISLSSRGYLSTKAILQTLFLFVPMYTTTSVPLNSPSKISSPARTGGKPFGFQLFNHGGFVSVNRNAEEFRNVFLLFLRLHGRGAQESDGCTQKFLHGV